MNGDLHITGGPFPLDHDNPFQMAFFQTAAICLILNAADGRILEVNDAAATFYGHSRVAMRNKYLRDFHPLLREPLSERMPGAADDQAFRIRTQHRAAQGEIREVLIFGAAVHIGGSLLHFCMVQDLSLYQAAQEQLLRTQQKAERNAEIFRHFFQDNSAVALIVDPVEMRIVDANHAAEVHYGWSRRELIGKSIREINTQPRCQLAEMYRRIIQAGSARVETRHRLANQDIRDVEIYITVFEEAGRQLLFGIIHDITERKKNQASLQLAHSALEATVNGVIICDAQMPDMPIIYMNAGLEKISGYQRRECLGRNPRFLHRGDPNQPGIERIRQALRSGKPVGAELRNYRKDGTPYWTDVYISPVIDSDGKVTHYIGIQKDISERKRAEARMNRLALFDSLTELPNRQLLLDRLSHALTLAQRTGKSGALAFIDLDHFKNINDAEGHSIGDQLLIETAHRLRNCLRQEDTHARLGGDDFVILLTGLNEDLEKAAQEASYILDRVRFSLEEPFAINGGCHRLAASIGVRIFPGGRENPAELLQQAETAMYKAKTAGRDTITYFQPAMQTAVQERLRLEREMRDALAHQDFQLFLQPQVDQAGRIIGAEALIRWQKPDGSLVSPGTFIPLAEDNGLIIPMGEWMIQRACRTIARLQDHGCPLRIAVNVSPRQFRVGDFKDRISKIIGDTDIAPALLALEVTEAVIFDNLIDAARAMHEIKRLGVTFSIDDFGTGYASLSYLKKLPVSEIKIDRSFIQDAPRNPNDAALVEAILAVARLHGLQAVAEGVETAEQGEFLKQRGCPLFQGFLFGRPVPAGEFVARMESAAPAPPN